MGKNKNRNNKKRNQPLTVVSKSSTSDAMLNKNPAPLPEGEKCTAHKENIQHKRGDLLNQTLKTNPLNKSESQPPASHLLPVKDHIKESSRKDFTHPVATKRIGYREDIDNEWEEFFNGPSISNTFKNSNSHTLVSSKMKPNMAQTAVNEASGKDINAPNPLTTGNTDKAVGVFKFSEPSITNAIKNSDFQTLVSDKMKLMVAQTDANEALIKVTPSFNKVSTQNVSSNSRKDMSEPNHFITKNKDKAVGTSKFSEPSLTNALKNSDSQTLVSGKMKPKVAQIAENKALIKVSPSFNKLSTQNVSRNSRNDISKPNHFVARNSDKADEISKLVRISNGNRSEVNKPIYPEASKFNAKVYSKDSSESMYESLNICEEKYHNFRRAYYSWRKKRQETIRELGKLKNDVHTDQRLFNQANALFKDLNVASRIAKTQSNSMSVDFLTSLATLATDAVSGVTSVAQAFNIDSYMGAFAKIMERDKEFTIPFYVVRSLYLKQYQNVEEVFRKYHSDSFCSTVANISNTLNLEDLWLFGEGKDKISTEEDCLGRIVSLNLNNEVMGKICNTIQDYTEKNPATLNAFISAGKVCYDIYDTWRIKPKGSFSRVMSQVANNELLSLEMAEVRELRSIANNDYEVQARLESDISEAIDGLRGEMIEIDSNFNDFCSSFKSTNF